VRYAVQCQPTRHVLCNTKRGLELTACIREILNPIKGDKYQRVRLLVWRVFSKNSVALLHSYQSSNDNEETKQHYNIQQRTDGRTYEKL
jgi:hypothetical protein